jgi:flavin-dependent dehydrogenase
MEDVYIAGAGPAGLAAAIAARRRGLRVTVADPARPEIDKACGEGLLPEALSSLRALGVGLDPAEGAVFRGIRFLQPGTAVEAAFPHGYGLGIRRKRLHRILVDHATALGVHIEWGKRFTGAPPGCGWVVGADGQNSAVRDWAGLDRRRVRSRRFGYRQHFCVVPWTDRVEVHWADRCQAYVTPVGAQEICVALISRDRRIRFDDLYATFPELAGRLRGAHPTSAVKGAVSVTCRVARVANDRVALVGDAAGTVDAITGQGLALAFQQAVALGDALALGDLDAYRAACRRIVRLPAAMANLMLQMDRHPRLRGGALSLLAAEPLIFARLLAIHVGQSSEEIAGEPAAGWQCQAGSGQRIRTAAG